MAFVSTHSFTEDQLQTFTAYLDFQSRTALKKHTAFMADIYRITDNMTPNEGTNTPAHNNTEFINCQDLAESCSQLTEDCGHEQTLEFLSAFDVWFSTAFQGSTDRGRKKSELWFKCT